MKTIKRPLKTKNMEENFINKLNDVIDRTNLYITNIYNFVKLYSVANPENYDFITKDNLYEIFLVLRDGNDAINPKFKDFYKQKFKDIYFNPNSNSNELIDATHLNQIIKNNIAPMFTAIQNNFIYHFDKRLSKFVREFMKSNSKEQLEYNSLIKKCSLYEFYKNVKKNNIKLLQKEYTKTNTFSSKNLRKLADEINKQPEKIKFSRKSLTNIFIEELQKVKNYEENFNKIKSTILKFIKEEIKDENEIPIEYKSILDFKKFTFPGLINEYNEDLKNTPFKFMKACIYINNYFEKNKIKTFNVFPSRSNVIPKHITLDTASISVIFCKNAYQSIEEHKKEIYKKVFKFPESYFKLNNKYQFSGTIQTDGVSLSLLYLFNENYEKKLKITDIKHNAKRELFIIKAEKKKYEKELTNLSKTDPDYSKKKRNINKEIKNINIKLEEREKLKKEKAEKSKELKNRKIKEYKDNLKKLKNEGKTNELKIINRNNKEFYYLEDLTEEELEELKNTEKRIYIDQGKTELIYCLNELNNTYMKYSGKERGKVIKTKEHANKINSSLQYYGITTKQDELKKLNKKTIDEIFLIETIKKMNEINKEIYNKCKVKRLRKEKLEMYIDKQKAESMIINKLIKQLKIPNLKELKEYTIIIGDWKGNNSLKNNKATMGVGMKRLLKKYVKNMYLMDEYNTSKISNLNYEMYDEKNKEQEEYYLCKEHKLEITSINKKTLEKTVINKQIHGILTFKMDKKRIQCNLLHISKDIECDDQNKILRLIQRDKNAVLNFKTILTYYLKNKDRPLAFKRSTMVGSKPTKIARSKQQCIEDTQILNKEIKFKKAVC